VKWRNLVADAKHHSAHDGEGEKKSSWMRQEAAARAIGNAFVQEPGRDECDEEAQAAARSIPSSHQKRKRNNIVEEAWNH